MSIGAPVQYAGIPVGHVVSIEVDPNNVEQIKVEVEVDTGTVIKSDASAGLETNLLSGVSSIQISGGKKDSPALAAKEGQRYPVINSRRNDLALVYTRVPKLLDRTNELIENLNETGFPDPKHLMAADLPLIQKRLALIDQLAPSAKDAANAAGFKEAKKDLLKMRDDLLRTAPLKK